MAGYIDRAAVAQSLNLIGATTALTLVYNDHRPTVEKMRSDLQWLKRRVDRAIFGRHHAKMAPADLCQVWAVIEGLGEHPHLHTGWKLPIGGQEILAGLLTERPGGLGRQAAKPPAPLGLWQRLAPAGTYHLSTADEGWATYATKQLTTTDCLLFVVG